MNASYEWLREFTDFDLTPEQLRDVITSRAATVEDVISLRADLRDVGGVLYLNDGDWVESCTALIENQDGSLEILEWAKLRSWSMLGRAGTALDLVPAGEKAAA